MIWKLCKNINESPYVYLIHGLSIQEQVPGWKNRNQNQCYEIKVILLETCEVAIYYNQVTCEQLQYCHY